MVRSTLSACVLAAVQSCLLAGTFAFAADELTHDLIELLDDHAPDVLARAESLYSQLSKDGAPNPKAAHALALLCTREGKLDRAVELLGALPNEAKLELPVLRLRLWLALERDEKQIPERLLKMMPEQLGKAKLTATDRLNEVRFLGGIAGVFPSGDTATLSQAIVADTVKELTSGDKQVSSAFRSAQLAAQKRRQQLVELVSEVTKDQAAAKERLTEAELKQPTLKTSLDDAQAKLKDKLVENRDEDKKTQPQIRLLSRQILALRREWNVPTPGQPTVPKQPKPVANPRPPIPDAKGNISAAAQNTYERERREYQIYRVEMIQYQQEVATYPTRLAAWKTLDEQRRTTLKAQTATADSELATAKAADQAREDEADTLRRDVAEKQTATRDLDLKIRLLRAVVSANAADASGGLLAHPSNYELLSFPAERQRLLQSLRVALNSEN